ncbi:MAG: OmpH family outer membrane protein [Deltaproteobacteria bacterium]|nr:OmpH family outer membrane protein [Deltaproteobacteria bacterium]
MKTFSKLFLIALLCISASAYADFRVATVDMDRVLNETKEAQSKRKELEDLKATKKKSLDSKKNDLLAMEKKLKAKKVEKDSKELADYRAQARDFARLAKDAEEELKRKYLRSTKALLDKARGIIEKYAQEQKLTLVLEEGTTPGNAVLFSNDKMDISAEIVKRMNAS